MKPSGRATVKRQFLIRFASASFHGRARMGLLPSLVVAGLSSWVFCERSCKTMPSQWSCCGHTRALMMTSRSGSSSSISVSATKMSVKAVRLIRGRLYLSHV